MAQGRSKTSGGAEQKVDRRILLTRALIKEAFLELKRDRKLSDIKVTDLCSRAGIGRGTFYRHYKNMSEVLDAVLDDVFAESSTLSQYVLARGEGRQCAECKMPFCHFIRDNRHYAGIFMDPALTEFIVEKMVSAQIDDYESAFAGRSDLSHEQLGNLLYFHSSGCLALVRRNKDASAADWKQTQDAVDRFIVAGLAANARHRAKRA